MGVISLFISSCFVLCDSLILSIFLFLFIVKKLDVAILIYSHANKAIMFTLSKTAAQQCVLVHCMHNLAFPLSA